MEKIVRSEIKKFDEQGDFQVMPTKLLEAAARGEVDLNAYAKLELANRGLYENGHWVGFDKAYELFNIEDR